MHWYNSGRLTAGGHQKRRLAVNPIIVIFHSLSHIKGGAQLLNLTQTHLQTEIAHNLQQSLTIGLPAV